MSNHSATDNLHPIGLLPPRAALGSTMLFHGVQKLRDTHKSGQAFEAMGVAPGRPWARATALAEAFAGAATLLGVLTRPAALAVLVTQSVAIAKVHGRKGFDNTKGGYEFNLALMAIAAGLLLVGPGRISLHHGIKRALRESRWASLITPRRRTRSKVLRTLAMLLR